MYLLAKSATRVYTAAYLYVHNWYLLQKTRIQIASYNFIVIPAFSIWAIQSSVTINTFLRLTYIIPRYGLFKFVTYANYNIGIQNFYTGDDTVRIPSSL